MCWTRNIKIREPSGVIRVCPENNQMKGVAIKEEKRDREKQLQEKKNQKLSSGRANLKVPVQYPSGESGRQLVM